MQRVSISRSLISLFLWTSQRAVLILSEANKTDNVSEVSNFKIKCSYVTWLRSCSYSPASLSARWESAHLLISFFIFIKCAKPVQSLCLRRHTLTCAVRRFWGSGLCRPGLTGSFPRPAELWRGGGCTEDAAFWTTGTCVRRSRTRFNMENSSQIHACILYTIHLCKGNIVVTFVTLKYTHMSASHHMSE